MISAKHGAQTDRRRTRAPVDSDYYYLPELARKYRRSRSWFYRQMKRDPDFPRPIYFGSRLAWERSNWDQYLATRPVYQPRKGDKNAPR